MIKKLILTMVSLVLFASCASRASSIAPASVSALEYKELSCDETKGLLRDKREAENALTKKQNNAATGDAVGVFFVLLPVGSIFGADVAGELAEVKGEVNALERAVVQNCK
tara:strand:- start:154 stop:486 length:333 start_codon:yes stop_codon:yes gene_type:complete